MGRFHNQSINGFTPSGLGIIKCDSSQLKQLDNYASSFTFTFIFQYLFFLSFIFYLHCQA